MIPSRRLVVSYVATAHLSLVLAFGLVAWNPHAVAGFFYHSWMIGVVHLITIGWIAMSILGNVYIVLPMECGVAFPARAGDYAAYALVTVGLIGMVAHFWIAEFGGMAWSAMTAAAGVVYVMARLAWTVRRAKVPGGVKLHLYFAAANIFGAVTFGVLLGFDKIFQFLPGYVLSNVFAHAHLAAVGWVVMIAMGFAYRLLPMIIPAATPSGPTIHASAVLLEIGVAGLVVSLVLQSPLILLFSLTIVASFVAFGAHVVWILRHRKLAPPGRPAEDFSNDHIYTAGAWLIAAALCGVALTALPVSESTLRLALLYGVVGLVGGLAQLVIGFERRTLATAAAYWALQRGLSAAPPSPASAWRRPFVYYAWLAGVPTLGGGLFLNAAPVLTVGAGLLFAAALLMSIDNRASLRRHATCEVGRACDRCA